MGGDSGITGINLSVLEHQLRKDGYDDMLVDEILEALRQKKEWDDYKNNLPIRGLVRV